MESFPCCQERRCEVSDTPITDANVCITTKEGCETIAPDICRKFERENAAMREAIKEAYKLIDVLYMDALDNHKESWPRAREWMEQWKEVAK